MAKKIYGIVGHPVSHSLSPAMQNAAFKALGMDAEYQIFDITPEDLEDFLKGIAEREISGLNVTIPHKIKAKDYIERYGSLDENAKRLGAVNTIKVIDGTLEGYNTDGPGFYRSLVEDLKFEPEGRNVLVLGAGGASMAIIMYLGNGPKEIAVMDIDDKKCEALKDHFKIYYDEKRLDIVRREELKEALEKAELLINATPVGMKKDDPSPIDAIFLRPGLYVYDLVYNQPMTRLMKDAKERKVHAVAGTGMLLYQGTIAFEIWTGQKAPVAVMRRALKKGIG
ncbi:MAG: shikimate dehydrogenase [Candidatus Omnitrophica bacterium]|nr:shikimate dehydrogenase [Candidatus Omnitrophota bacterium]